MNWLESHPQIAAVLLTLVVVPLVTGFFNRLLKPRTPEEFAAMPRWLAQTLRILAALFPDPTKVSKIVAEGITKPAIVPASDIPEDSSTKPLPPDPPSGAGGLGVLVLAVALVTTTQACALTAEAAYRKQQEACVRDSKTREESRACRARVRHEWGMDLEPTIVVSDAGAPDAAE